MDKFTIVDGTEQYRVVDLATSGVSYFSEKLDAYKMAAYLANGLKHGYQIEDRKMKWVSIGGPV